MYIMHKICLKQKTKNIINSLLRNLHFKQALKESSILYQIFLPTNKFLMKSKTSRVL